MIRSLVCGKIGMESAIAACQVLRAVKAAPAPAPYHLHLRQNRPRQVLAFRRVLVFHPAQAQVLLKGKL